MNTLVGIAFIGCVCTGVVGLIAAAFSFWISSDYE